MPYETWREAATAIREATSRVTNGQQRLAALAGVTLPEMLPRLVAAARLQGALAGELNLPKSRPINEFQTDILADLETDEDRIEPRPADQREADAWISVLRLKQRLRHLERLQLVAGDVVEVEDRRGVECFEVSSITGEGRVIFKAQGGPGGWPDVVTVRCRQDDSSSSAEEFRRTAANCASLRARGTTWSIAKQQELEEYAVEVRATPEDIEQLRRVIDSATDERPIQEFLEVRPQLLAELVAGHFRYCLPRPRFADKYVPDFLLSDVNSLGVNWTLIELETPASPVLLADGSQLDQYARKGMSQVEEWREWLSKHLAQARRSKRDADGLGLFDIRSDSRGIVLVGRRALLRHDEREIRFRMRERFGVEVHTYDWLLDTIAGAVNFTGMTGENPYKLRGPRDGVM